MPHHRRKQHQRQTPRGRLSAGKYARKRTAKIQVHGQIPLEQIACQRHDPAAEAAILERVRRAGIPVAASFQHALFAEQRHRNICVQHTARKIPKQDEKHHPDHAFYRLSHTPQLHDDAPL